MLGQIFHQMEQNFAHVHGTMGYRMQIHQMGERGLGVPTTKHPMSKPATHSLSNLTIPTAAIHLPQPLHSSLNVSDTCF